jgi:hypothetical protein
MANGNTGSRQMDRTAVESRKSTIEYLPIASIFADPKNPRVHSREQIRAIARSIEAFGFNAPILVDKKSQVVAGHGRLEAAKLLEIVEIPVIRLEHLSEPQARAYMLADNKLTDRSGWNDDHLAQCLKDLQGIALDFDIEATGFEAPEIDLRIQSLELGDQGDAADEVEEPKGPVISRLGDVWQLGQHRLVCGDALNADAYRVLLGEELAGCVFMDSPYNVKIDGHAVGNGKKRHREFAMASGEMSSCQFTRFLTTVLQHVRSHTEDAAVSFVLMDWRHCREALTAIDQVGCEAINLCVWAKTNGGMGALYRSAHELVFVIRGCGARHRNNVQLGRFGRNRTNVWHYAGMNSFAPRGRSRALDLHPTVKPITMVADAILDVSKRGDIVLDPFCGSGTTILAAERTGRRGYGIELDAVYVDVAITRWQKMTNQLVMHSSGKSFAELRAARLGQDEAVPLANRPEEQT